MLINIAVGVSLLWMFHSFWCTKSCIKNCWIDLNETFLKITPLIK